jgi:hypothetical protein
MVSDVRLNALLGSLGVLAVYDSEEVFLESVQTGDAVGAALLLAKVAGLEKETVQAHPWTGKLRKLREQLAPQKEVPKDGATTAPSSEGAGQSSKSIKLSVSKRVQLEEDTMKKYSGLVLGRECSSPGGTFLGKLLKMKLPGEGFEYIPLARRLTIQEEKQRGALS